MLFPWSLDFSVFFVGSSFPLSKVALDQLSVLQPHLHSPSIKFCFTTSSIKQCFMTLRGCFRSSFLAMAIFDHGLILLYVLPLIRLLFLSCAFTKLLFRQIGFTRLVHRPFLDGYWKSAAPILDVFPGINSTRLHIVPLVNRRLSPLCWSYTASVLRCLVHVSVTVGM